MTRNISHSVLALLAATLFGAAAPAQAFTLDFEGAGTTAQSFAPAGLTIGYGVYVPYLDGFGDPILGSEHWELDLSAPPVPVGNPNDVGFGLAPSGVKALDARDGAVLLVFDAPVSFTGFSATLDNSTFGNLIATNVEFFGADNALLASVAVDQTIPGVMASAGALSGVKTIVLAPTAFYDNISFTGFSATPVPEPGSALVGVACLGLIAMRRRL
jgi:hypothetical protein